LLRFFFSFVTTLSLPLLLTLRIEPRDLKAPALAMARCFFLLDAVAFDGYLLGFLVKLSDYFAAHWS